jgi:hypothetical protein
MKSHDSKFLLQTLMSVLLAVWVTPPVRRCVSTLLVPGTVTASLATQFELMEYLVEVRQVPLKRFSVACRRG